MRFKVLVSPNTLLPVFNKYRSILIDNSIEPIIPPPFNEFLSEDELFPLVADIDGAICGDDQFTEKVLRNAQKLKVLSKWGEGLDAIDLVAAKKLNIAVYRTKGALTDPVADTVMGYILAFARNLITKDKFMKKGEWKKFPAVTLKESVLGIIGYGKIGRAVAKRAKAFGMKILVNDIQEIHEKFLKEHRVKLCTLNKLIIESDFISLNCNLNQTSYRLIGYNELKKMQKHTFLINTSRGEIVDESALIDALNNRIIAGAALDVFEKEPLSIKSELRKMENCLLSAHNANSSPSVFDFIHKKTIDNLIVGLNIKKK